MSEIKRGEPEPRMGVLYHAYDLFSLHRSVACPSCGQWVRDSGNEKRVARLRRIIQSLFDETVPQPFQASAARLHAARFVDELADLAAHSLSGEESSRLVRNMMTRYLERLERDHENSAA